MNVCDAIIVLRDHKPSPISVHSQAKSRLVAEMRFCFHLPKTDHVCEGVGSFALCPDLPGLRARTSRRRLVQMSQIYQTLDPHCHILEECGNHLHLFIICCVVVASLHHGMDRGDAAFCLVHPRGLPYTDLNSLSICRHMDTAQDFLSNRQPIGQRWRTIPTTVWWLVVESRVLEPH